MNPDGKERTCVHQILAGGAGACPRCYGRVWTMFEEREMVVADTLATLRHVEAMLARWKRGQADAVLIEELAAALKGQP